MTNKTTYTYKEIAEVYGSQYRVAEAVRIGELYRVNRGIYSVKPDIDQFAVIATKYPYAIVAADTAYYLHGLTDVIPVKIQLATKRNVTRIKDTNITQIFVSENLFEHGKSEIIHNGVVVNIYNRERMLIETLRKSSLMPFDYYKEIITSYRKIVDDLDYRKIEEYAGIYKRNEHLFEAFQREVL
jgi:predicted transcriptional regulator of viral defense system